MSIFESVTSLFAPNNCLGCGREGNLLCAVCLPRLPALPGRCFRCYTRLPSGVSCPACLLASGLDHLRAVVSYEGLSKDLLTQLKFHGNQSAAKVMVQLMLADWQPPTTNTLLTRIPATTAHIRQRGYDQAELLARLIARQTGRPQITTLRRLGQHHQLGSSRQERLQQLETALRIASVSAVKGRHIIVIDDVITTGSSLTAAAKVLRAAGATQIDALVFAQA